MLLLTIEKSKGKAQSHTSQYLQIFIISPPIGEVQTSHLYLPPKDIQTHQVYAMLPILVGILKDYCKRYVVK